MDGPTVSLTARWILPAVGPNLPGGIVTIAGDRILAVEPGGTRRVDLDLGNALVMPGMVNAHTHLDLSGLRGLAPPCLPLPDWLEKVIAHRRTRSPEEVQRDIQTGLEESLLSGTTLLGDVSSDGASWEALSRAPIRALIFRELLGSTPERAEATLGDAASWLVAHPATPTCRPGLSPHAPYSVRAEVVGRSSVLAENHGGALAIHLAESAEELQLLRDHTGPFRPFLEKLGVWDPSGLARSAAQIMRAGAWRETIPRLFIHGNYLRPNAAIRPNATVIYCPRTHAAFGHPPHPIREFLNRKRRVALGTDSLASNPDLSLLAEARFLHRIAPELPAEEIARMATLRGAEALGWADETGSLEPGKSADLIVVPLRPNGPADPLENVLQGDEPVSRVLFRGNWVKP